MQPQNICMRSGGEDQGAQAIYNSNLVAAKGKPPNRVRKFIVLKKGIGPF